jgi:TRAP transporter TAXI family solute receptor
MRRLLPLFLLLLALAGCSAGPDAETLRKDVAERLAQSLPPGSMTLAGFVRRGSQSDTKAREETRRVVYFDVELKVERDIDFGAWDAPGVAGLVSALGAGPKGIVGIQAGGNKAGDRVSAHGTALYRRDGDTWVAVAPAGYRPSEAPAYATSAPARGPAAILDAMRKVLDSVQKESSPDSLAVIEEELAIAQATINARLTRAAKGYAIAAGPEHGQYLRFARALSEIKPGHTVPLVTLGGEENLELLRAGKVSLALAQGDAALAAYEGSGAFEHRGADPTLRALGSLYPEPVHVLVLREAPYATPADLRGRRVAIGRPGSASRTTALRVLEAHGLQPADVKAVELSLSDAMVGLQRREVDAVIQVIGVPADSVRDAIATIPLRLLPLADGAIAKLTRGRNGLFAHTVPTGAYATQAAPVRTVATAALMLVADDLSDAEVGKLARFVYDKGGDFAAHGSAQGLQVSAANAQQGLTVPLHVVAARTLGVAPNAAAGPVAASAPRSGASPVR